MNVVIYTRGLEPITIIDLPMWAIEMGEKRQVVRVEITDEIPTLPSVRYDIPLESYRFRSVALEFHKMRFFDAESHLITTRDEEFALLLKPSWLPGQRGAINTYEKRIRNLSEVLLRTLGNGMGGH